MVTFPSRRTYSSYMPLTISSTRSNVCVQYETIIIFSLLSNMARVSFYFLRESSTSRVKMNFVLRCVSRMFSVIGRNSLNSYAVLFSSLAMRYGWLRSLRMRVRKPNTLILNIYVILATIQLNIFSKNK
jgi:hypothetical protein